MSICVSDMRPDARLGEAGALPGERGVREPSLPKELPRCLRAARRHAGGAAGGFTFPPSLLPQDGGGRAAVGQMRCLEAADTAGPLVPPEEPQLGAAAGSAGLRALGCHKAGGGPHGAIGPCPDRGTRGQPVLEGWAPGSVCMKPAETCEVSVLALGSVCSRLPPNTATPRLPREDTAPWQQSPLPRLVRKAEDLVLLVRLPPPLVQSSFAW